MPWRTKPPLSWGGCTVMGAPHFGLGRGRLALVDRRGRVIALGRAVSGEEIEDEPSGDLPAESHWEWTTLRGDDPLLAQLADGKVAFAEERFAAADLSGSAVKRIDCGRCESSR